jgi:hypothetical protein
MLSDRCKSRDFRRTHNRKNIQNQHELDYAAKTADVLKQMADRRKSMNEKNDSTALENTTDDI